MFMVKGEFENTKRLLKVKMKSMVKNLKWFMVVAPFMVLTDIIPKIIFIARNNEVGVTPYTIQDYSFSFFFGLAICFFVMMLNYRQTNDYLSVFPQTNNSRFAASQLMNCVIAITTGLIVMAMYLMDCGIVKLISNYYDNVYLALDFSIVFIITGFLTFIVYSLIVIAVFGFIGAILRKWTYYAAAAFTAVFSFMAVNIRLVNEYAPRVFSPIVSEPNPVLFMLKGVTLCIVLTGISLVINNYTVYYKTQKKFVSVGTAISCAIVAVIIMVASSVVLFSASGGNAVSNEIHALTEEEYFAGFDKICIDTTHLPKGSKLNVKGENVIFPELLDSYETTNYNLAANGVDALNNLQGDTITILYQFPTYQINGCEVFKYANPKLYAYLDGDTLHLEYTFENNHVVILPIWGFAGQFDCFKDKNLLTQSGFGFSSGGGGGYIYVKP